MIGILSTGAYVPILRLNRDNIAKAWGRPSLKGERSVANNDEDSATMAVEAAFQCLKHQERSKIDGLFFASTTAPYREKQSATLVANVLDLTPDTFTVDYANSLRCGTSAIKTAFDMVNGAGAKSILVTASDSRIGYPRSDFEQTFGDGAGAVLIGEGSAIATLECFHSVNNEMMDVWRKSEDQFVRSAESRWALGEGYLSVLERSIKGLFNKSGIGVGDISKAVIPAPDLRSHRSICTRIGFDSQQIQDPLIVSVGNCGTAQPLMMLDGALETAAPGDRILLANYGDGADAFILKITDEILNRPVKTGLNDLIISKLEMPSYERYLSYRGVLETVPGEPFRLLPSTTAYWRDNASILRCHGSKCLTCGVITYPIQRVCYECYAKDHYEIVRLSERKGKVFTYSLDNLAGRSDDPVVVQTIIELETDSTRFYGMMTDCIPSDVKIGMPVELTFRKIYDGAGFYNYFWKCRPIRERE